MKEFKTPEAIYKKIINEDIRIESGLNRLISLLHENEDNEFLFECKKTIGKLTLQYKEIFDILRHTMKNEHNPFIKFNIVKLIIVSFPKKCKIFVQEHIKRENSAIFLTSLYKFLISQTTKISEILQKTLIKKYEKIYDLDSSECEFIIDLENTQVNKVKLLDINSGYFKKFETNDLNLLENSSLVNYVVKNRHIQAIDLSRWEFGEIPESIKLLSELSYLNLSNLQLTSLPRSIKNLGNLKYLNLKGNQFSRMPKWVFEFVGKRIVKKYLNEGVIPSEVIILAIIEVFLGYQLEKVEKSKKIINWEIAHNFKINNDGNITGIYIKTENSKLGIFPEQLCMLEYLEELELPDSNIQNIPQCIGNLRSLKYFNLYNNRIKTVPKAIEKLNNLEYLDLDDNLMSEKDLLTLRWYRIGQQYLEVGDFNNALIECKDTLLVYPKNRYAWYHLGIAYKELHKFKDAERAFLKFLKLDDKNSLIWSELGEIYHSNKEYHKAIEAIQHAIYYEPEAAVLFSNLAFNYKKLGKFEEAIEAYLQSLELNPKNIYVWRDLASIYRNKGEILKAIDADEHALDLEHELKKK